MLHGYKKSRYNIYDNLEFLGLNPYEQKHFCFGEGGSEGNGEGGLDVDSLSTDTPGLSAPEAAAAAAEADAAMSAAGLNAADSPEAAQAAMDAAAANAAGYDLGDYSDAVSQAAPSSNELDALEETGLIGYNDKVALGYLDTIERENRQSDINLARSIADKYGLDSTQVQPGFTQDPSLGPQTMSYTGPGALGAAATEIGRGAANLAGLVAETYPGIVNFASIIAEEEFGLKTPSLGLKEGINDYFDKVTASQRETNRAARGITETEQASSIDRSQQQSSTDYFDPPQTLSQQVASAPEAYEFGPNYGVGAVSPSQQFAAAPEAYEFGPNYGLAPSPEIDVQQVAGPFTDLPSQPQSAVDYYDVPPSQQQSSATNFFSDIPDGNEIIPRTVSKTPSAAPTPEPEVKVVREPVTRTPATDTFSILANIYGPEVAAQLLPNRIIT
tara:strand:- start:931 stop:2259 length:1329 start_codon:yes stop_codon:yes gene_type:complete